MWAVDSSSRGKDAPRAPNGIKGNADVQELRDASYRRYVSTHQGDLATAGKVADFEDNFLRFAPPGRDGRVLDVGCGQGVLLSVLKKHGYRDLSGIDTSEEQVALARGAGYTQVHCDDVFDFAASQSERFDVIFAVDFAEHFDRSEVLRLFEALYDLLEPGGSLVLRSPNGVSPFSGRYLYSDITHGTIYTERSLRQVAALVGFDSVAVYPTIPSGRRFKRLRRLVWRAVSTVVKIPLIVETGQLRGHVVTQNLIAVMNKSSR